MYFNAKAKRKMKEAETNLFTSSGHEAGFLAQDTHLQTKPIEKIGIFSSTIYIKRISSEKYINSMICKK